MFYILSRSANGICVDTYFRSFEGAELEMMRQVNELKQLYEVVGSWSIDRMNLEAGVYDREETILIKGGKRYHFAILDGYFMDDVNNKEG